MIIFIPLMITFISIVYLLYKNNILKNNSNKIINNVNTLYSNLNIIGGVYNTDSTNINEQYITLIDEELIKKYNDDLNELNKISLLTRYLKEDNDKLTINSYNFIIENNIIFTNRNNKILEIFPQYMIVSWASESIPKGWALCDGNRYILNLEGDAEISIYVFDSVLTPDLRSRFVIGASKTEFELNNINTSDVFNGNYVRNNKINMPLNKDGGTLAHSLTNNDEIPSHNHEYNEIYNTYNYIHPSNTHYFDDPSYFPGDINSACSNSSGHDFYYLKNNKEISEIPDTSKDPSNEYTSLDGGENKPHNNMPPFHSLYYIMKL